MGPDFQHQNLALERIKMRISVLGTMLLLMNTVAHAAFPDPDSFAAEVNTTWTTTQACIAELQTESETASNCQKSIPLVKQLAPKIERLNWDKAEMARQRAHKNWSITASRIGDIQESVKVMKSGGM